MSHILPVKTLTNWSPVCVKKSPFKFVNYFFVLPSPTEGTICCEHKCGRDRGGCARWWTKVPFPSFFSSFAFNIFQGPEALHLLYWQHEEQMGECVQEHQGKAGGRVRPPIPSKHSKPLLRKSGGGAGQPVGPPPILENSHVFQEYTYKKITPCDVCSQMLVFSLSIFSSLLAHRLRGHTRQGLKCKLCR